MATRPEEVLEIYKARVDNYSAVVDAYKDTARAATASNLMRYREALVSRVQQEDVQRAIHQAMIAQYQSREAQAMQQDIPLTIIDEYMHSLNEAEEAAAKITAPCNPVPKGWERKMIR